MKNKKEPSLEDINAQLIALIKAYATQDNNIQQLKNKVSKMENTIMSLQARKS